MDKEFDYRTHQDTPVDELKYPFSDELRCNCMDELKAAAFEYLLLHPSSKFGDWQQGLISGYPAEVVDALGNNSPEVFADLTDMWESDFEDPNTGICQKFSEWAMSFANEHAVGIYYFLVDACTQSPDVALMSKNRQVPCDNRLRGCGAGRHRGLRDNNQTLKKAAMHVSIGSIAAFFNFFTNILKVFKVLKVFKDSNA